MVTIDSNSNDKNNNNTSQNLNNMADDHGELKEIRNEEIVALSSIYADDFVFVDEGNDCFEIRVICDADIWWSLTLRITLPQGYPLTEPPVLKIFGECLKSDYIEKVYSELGDIWLENVGTSVLHLWVEKCREMLCEAKAIYKESHKEIEDSSETSSPDQNLPEPGISVSGAIDQSETVELFSQPVCVGEPKSLHNYRTESNDDLEVPEILSGEPIVDRKSTFQAHVASVLTEGQVKAVIRQLMENRKVARASHNIMAYRIEGPRKDHFLHDCDDDGENEAGSRLMHLLEILDAKNIIVVVSRWYGGILLGPDRFKHINNCARELIVSSGIGNVGNDKKVTSGDAKRATKGKLKKGNKH